MSKQGVSWSFDKRKNGEMTSENWDHLKIGLNSLNLFNHFGVPSTVLPSVADFVHLSNRAIFDSNQAPFSVPR